MAEDRRSDEWVRRFFCYSVLKRKRRSGALILRDILLAAEKGAKKTHIMFGTNMNPLVLTRYLDFAVKRGLLEQKAYIYFTTEKGREFLRWFGRLEELVEEVERVKGELAKLLE